EAADKKINKSDNLKVFLVTQRLFGGRPDDDRRIEFLAIAIDCIGCPRPSPEFIEKSCHMAVIFHSLAVDRFKNIATANAGFLRWTFRDTQPGLDPLGSLNPRGSIIRRNIPALLLRIEAAQNQDSQCQQNRGDVLNGPDLPAHFGLNQVSTPSSKK